MKGLYGSPESGTTVCLVGNLITSVEVHRNFRNRGYARMWMECVCADADREGEPLYLALEPQEPDVDINRLRTFYETLGFEVMSDDPDQRAMRREPRKE